MNKFIIIILIGSFTSVSFAQNFTEFMAAVKQNHPGITAASDLMNVGVANSKTGLTPDNPQVSLGYFPGKPDAAGTKRTWEISQTFDFPTRYSRLKKLKETRRDLAELEYNRTMLDLLSESEQLAIDFVAELRLYNVLEQRYGNFIRLQSAFNELYNSGEVTQIDFNKIRIRTAEMKISLAASEERILRFRRRLDFVSGNNSSILEESAFPMLSEIDRDKLIEDRMKNHPDYLIPLKNIEIAGKDIDLIKTGKLPALAVGYASELVANEEFIGPTFGLTIPLWENRGKLDLAKARLSYIESNAINEINRFEMEFERDFESFEIVRKNLDEINILIVDHVPRDLLNKAFESGELSLTDWLLELTTYYDIEEIQLDLEKRLYKLNSILRNHELLNQ